MLIYKWLLISTHAMIPDINELLSYTNAKILSRYSKNHPDSKMSGREALSELMKFIWLCCIHKVELSLRPYDETLHFSCLIYDEMAEIDDMWHIFLLFTRDYQKFCADYLHGYFFHHDPIVSDEIPLNFEINLRRYLEYIHDKLGEETLIKWFEKK
ncbi:hypothetical protein AQUSIP_24790 [Aquicella siphonis]|uniref:Uncharacterized protein n=1 Tax=Aquicella siphonis TaxID=254247 RepID=A0A5E4PLL4_9COXI|nr:hypothetical protein [Aquicella siphonis]VVC77152.1 hypothetical protein AQUSIP_24790 [Aquicella siphonis]